MMRKRIILGWKQFWCPHSEWDGDTQIRTIRCRQCGKKAWVLEYKDLI